MVSTWTQFRGLKSLRSSERGLKCMQFFHWLLCFWSLRSSERGLKSLRTGVIKWTGCVAPFVGAWIEIVRVCYKMKSAVSLRSSERGLK